MTVHATSRISIIADKAFEMMPTPPDNVDWQEYKEVFARLIIQECITAVINVSRARAYTTYDLDITEHIIQQSVKAINTHFGITK